MHNVSYEIKGGKLVITVDMSAKTFEEAPRSSTGKTQLVASTGGAVPLPLCNGKASTFALNVMTKG